MLQYTRYRRWTRVAVLNETVEHVDGTGDVGTRIEQSPNAMIRPLPPVLSTASSGSSEQTHTPLSPAVSPVSVATQDNAPTTAIDDDRSRLRQRLKAAVRGGSLG